MLSGKIYGIPITKLKKLDLILNRIKELNLSKDKNYLKKKNKKIQLVHIYLDLKNSIIKNIKNIKYKIEISGKDIREGQTKKKLGNNEIIGPTN
ncbi:MAG: hypothetical protein ACKA35_01140 [Candidatus Karelsulcia muelleri]